MSIRDVDKIIIRYLVIISRWFAAADVDTISIISYHQLIMKTVYHSGSQMPRELGAIQFDNPRRLNSADRIVDYSFDLLLCQNRCPEVPSIP